MVAGVLVEPVERGADARDSRAQAHRQLVAQYQALSLGGAGDPGVEHAKRWIPDGGLYPVHDLTRCPGTVRRHDSCGELSWVAYSCGHVLCPDCQSREGHRLGCRLGALVEARKAAERLYMRTYTMPNISVVDRDFWKRHKRAGQSMRRTKEYKAVTSGGWYTLETTWNPKRKDWHPHTHELVEGSYWPQWPTTDIEWVEDDGAWRVVRKWDGAALLWSRSLHKQGLLSGFDKLKPETWAFVDLRRADKSAVPEVSKYVSKAIVKGGLPLEKLLELVLSLQPDDGKGFRRRDLFGAWRGALDDDGDDDAEGEAPEPTENLAQECPCPWCSNPNGGKWEYGGHLPDSHELWWVPETSGYLVVDSDRAKRWRTGEEEYRAKRGRGEDSGWS